MRVFVIMVLMASLAHAASTPRRMFGPSLIGRTGPRGRSTLAANSLICVTAPAEHSITATKIAALYYGDNPTETCGFAVYPNSDGGTALISGSSTCPLGANGATGKSPATIVAGTLYRWCLCAQNQHTSPGSAGNAYEGVAQNESCCNTSLSHLVQAFHPTYFGIAASTCSAGVPPSTTGAITPDATSPKFNAPLLPIIMLEE